MNGALAAEAIGFLTLFDDLIVIDNIGGTGTGVADNLGKAQSLGLEFSTTFDAGMANNWGFSNPYFVTFTYTDATQRSSARSTNAESIFSFGEKGNKIPYIPEYQLTTGTSFDFAQWGLNFTASYVGETFTSASNVTTQVDGNGNPDARFGKTDSYWLLDMGAHYQVKQGIRILAGVHNLLNEKYIASRQPHGPLPGMPRMAYAGFELSY
jgi:Fe(3+) dicitrate transport protein